MDTRRRILGRVRGGSHADHRPPHQAKHRDQHPHVRKPLRARTLYPWSVAQPRHHLFRFYKGGREAAELFQHIASGSISDSILEDSYARGCDLADCRGCDSTLMWVAGGKREAFRLLAGLLRAGQVPPPLHGSLQFPAGGGRWSVRSGIHSRHAIMPAQAVMVQQHPDQA